MRRTQYLIRCLAFSTISLSAQVNANKASVAGVISDSSGAAIAEALVVAHNQATGLEREIRTNEAGVYQLDSLEPGTYELRAETSGFAASLRKVDLNVGATVRVNFTIRFQANAEVVDLSTSALPVTESSNTDLQTRESIRDLPINGRRFQDFATLAPTVQALPETRGQLSFAGQRAVYSNVMVDGTDYNQPFLGGIRGGERSTQAFTIPQSAIQEFQAIPSGYGPEYGRSINGILNAVTRSGGNSLHGDVFYHIRDQSLGATDPLGLESLERQHQFGGGVGGPILRDKLFFFGAAEQQLARFPRQVRFPALDVVSGNVTSDIRPAYDLFRSFERDFNQTNNATAVFGRGDYQISDGNHLALRYVDSRNKASNATSLGTSLERTSNQAYSTNGDDSVRTHTLGGQWTSILPNLMVNDTRVQYSRETAGRTPNAIGPYVEAGAIGSFGTQVTQPSTRADYRVQAADGLSFLKDRHSIAVGADYSYVSVSQQAGENQFGSFLISNGDVRQTLRILSGAPGQNRFDDPSAIYRRQVGDLAFSAASQSIALFAQDTWRVKPSFTLTYGLRWEGQINPTPQTDNEFLMQNVRDFNFPIGRVDPSKLRSPMNQWGPRLSFAWDVLGKQHTVIRGQAGVYYAQTPLVWLAAPLDSLSSAPSDLSLQIAPAGQNTIYRQFAAAGFDFNQYSLDRLPIFTVPEVWMNVAGKPNPFAQANVTTTSGGNFRNPRSEHLGLSVQHQMARGLLVEFQWRNIRSVHLERDVAINVPTPIVRPGDLSERPFFGLRSGTLRPNPNLGWILMRDSSARANYSGYTFRTQYRAGRFSWAGHYTLSYNKSDDDNERDLIALYYQNPFDFSREYNWSSLDARHQAAGQMIWYAPLGFEAAGLFRFRSGLPVDATTDGDVSEMLVGNRGNRPMERPGLPMLRNAFRNRAYRTIDLRVAKNILTKETARLQIYADLFNVFNFDNVAFISASLLPNNPAFIYGLGINPDGRIAPVDPRFLRLNAASGEYDPQTTAQQGTPFQAQLGVRFIF